MHNPHHPNAWLWRLFFLILLGGGGLCYKFYLDWSDPAARTAFSITLLITLIAAGICFISATAGWWMKR